MKGRKFQHTLQLREDLGTNRKVWQLTSLPGNHHHLYFTSNSFTKHNDHVLFISDMGGDSPNLFKLNLQSGEAVQLTSNNDGILKSYVYYNGNPYRGLGKASPSYNPAADTLLYLQGREVRLLDVGTMEEEVLYTLPERVMTGFTHMSTDGRYACVPYIPAEAFEVGEGNPFTLIREKVTREQIESKVLVIDTKTKTGDVWFSQVGWITHVQFHPTDPHKILYNHEGGMVEQRIWLYDHGEIKRVRDQRGTDQPLWICHEMWLQQGYGAIYHGTTGVPNDPAMSDLEKKQDQITSFVGRINLETGDIAELLFPAEMKAYGHFTASSSDERLVTDGIIDANKIHLVDANWQNRTMQWTEVCNHNSSFSVQDVHPHPIFSHDDRYLLFTSDAHNERGKGNLYLVEL